MSNSSTIRVRLRHANHPNGSRRRAGFIFGVQPSVVEVTEEQLAAIESDPYLQILPNKGTLPENEDDGNGDDDDGAGEVKITDKTPKAQLVSILTNELKLVPGVDFNPEAKNEVLRQLIIDLRAKAAEGNGDGQDDDDDDVQDGDGNGDGSDE
jgi:hypothetical protein